MPEQHTVSSRFFGRNVSVLLDVIRFGAASAVALHHLGGFLQAGPRVSGASANAAVCVFFVLSGFVIRYVTVSRKSTAREYFIDRASRIYSVVAPTLLLTILFEAIAFLHNPAFYYQFSQPYSWKQVPWQIATNLSFTSGYWGYGSAPLSNLPFWSLTFECVYYVLYGVLHYTCKSRWFLVPAILLIVGPSIALLFLVWWTGVWLFDAYRHLSASRRGIRIALIPLLLAGSFIISLRHRILGFLHATDVNWRRAQATHIASLTSPGRLLFHGAVVPWLDRLSISFYVTAVAFGVVLLFFIVLLDRSTVQISRPLESRIRRVADSTFTLYLLHLPLFILLFSFTGGAMRNWFGGLSMFLVAVALSIVLAIQFDNLKVWLRIRLRRRFVGSRGETALLHN
jgi:peptidoglycan/LPS O-acetylase OafA/YrhL